ncbi:enoyl-CoA hydratase/isomerase family protein [Caballeronia sp. 15715]|uniref:enoyl-CoA hydratase/isomerase family protein n=1 Tax=unclassified Caballeronia TaxID=2646786 RepID=UPI0039E707B3
MSTAVRVTFPSERVAMVTIDRPNKRNACDFDAWTALGDAFLTLATRDELRAMVLTGGGGHFCAGNDIGAAAAMANHPDYAERHTLIVERCFNGLRQMPFPVVAAIQGACVGGGCGLAGYCDFRLADRTARIGITAVAQAGAYPTALLARLVGIVGQSAARRWLYGGALHAAQDAARDGFVDRVVGGDVVNTALELASEWLDKEPLALRACRLQIDAIVENALDTRRDEIDAAITATRTSAARQEAVTAFLTKRRPGVNGR